jgi:CheY-like chemotaxis protein
MSNMNIPPVECHCVLVIEDDESIRETLRDLLEMERYTVLTAENGREGLRLLEENSQPCLILLDLMMPVMNGWEFLEALRNDPRHVIATIPVVISSGVADVSELQQRYRCAALKKPVDIDTLVSVASQYCQRC